MTYPTPSGNYELKYPRIDYSNTDSSRSSSSSSSSNYTEHTQTHTQTYKTTETPKVVVVLLVVQVVVVVVEVVLVIILKTYKHTQTHIHTWLLFRNPLLFYVGLPSKWQAFPGVRVRNGIQMGGDYLKPDQCVSLCDTDNSCLSGDYDTADGTCWLHLTPETECSQVEASDTVFHFKKQSCGRFQLNWTQLAHEVSSSPVMRLCAEHIWIANSLLAVLDISISIN